MTDAHKLSSDPAAGADSEVAFSRRACRKRRFSPPTKLIASSASAGPALISSRPAHNEPPRPGWPLPENQEADCMLKRSPGHALRSPRSRHFTQPKPAAAAAGKTSSIRNETGELSGGGTEARQTHPTRCRWPLLLVVAPGAPQFVQWLTPIELPASELSQNCVQSDLTQPGFGLN